MEKPQKRSQFTGKIGFVMAAAASAIGLGNIWRFPYLAARYGGGSFLLIYIIFVATLGYTLMTCELAVSRHARLGPSKAFGTFSPRWNFIGLIGAFDAFVIFSYYCVIGGWIIKYAFNFMTGLGQETATDGYFESYTALGVPNILFQMVFVIVTAVIVAAGVQKGIEKMSKILMPVLLILCVVIAVFVCAQPGALAGVKYFIMPELKNFSLQGCLAAMGQMFYSLSLSMGIMLAYGSYLPADEEMEDSVNQIEFFDTVVAILAGLMIIPAVFVYSGGDPAALGKGVGLMFVNLPKVFMTMKFGALIGTLFFVMVFFAALTSTISLFEATVASGCDSFHWSRKKSVVVMAVGTILLGIPSALSFGVMANVKIFGMTFFSFFDFITNSVLMPIAALCTCIFIGHVTDLNVILDEVKGNGRGHRFRREKMFIVMVKWIAPICILLILVSSVMEGLGIITF